MTFSVNTRALPGLVDMLARRRDDLEAGRTFLTKFGHIDEWDQGILNAHRGTHERVVAAIDQFLFRAAWQRADTYSSAVAAANGYYLRTDASAAARLDASAGIATHDDGHPEDRHPLANQQIGPEVFLETSCGPGYPEPHDYRFDYEPITSPWDIVSQTNWARAAVWGVTKVLADLGLIDRPIDPMQEFAEKVTGDWAAFRRCADVFDTLAVEVDLNADWVEHGAASVNVAWTGNAASACNHAVDMFGLDLRRAAQTLRNAATNYREAAEQMKEFANTLITVLTVVYDMCTDHLLDLTGDPEFAMVKEGVDIARLVHKLIEARHIIAAMVGLVHGLSEGTGLVGTELGAVGEIGPLELTPVETSPLPGGPRGGSHWLVAE